MAEYFDMMGNINSMNQGFNALGDLGRFMLQKRGMDMQQKQQDYLNRQADRKRMLDEAKAEQIRQIMLGTQARRQTVATPYTVTEEVDVTEPTGVVDGGDIAAYMQQPVAIYNREKTDKQVPSMVDQGDFSGLAGQAPEWIPPDIAAYMQGAPGASPMAKAVEAPKKVDPLDLLRQMPISPVEAVRRIGTQKIERTEMREHTEDVPNENWLGDAARGVAAIDPELGMEMANSDAQAKRIQASAQDSKAALLNEMKTLTYGINTTANAEQKQLLSDQLAEVSGRYLSLFGAKPEEKPDPGQWLRDYTGKIALAAYGKNADGTITDVARLKSDISAAAKSAGYTVLDKDISSWVDQKNEDLSAAYSSGVKKKTDEVQIAGEAERLKQTKLENAYKLIDLKYPNLRTSGIELVNNAITFIEAGNKGDLSARNNLVKKISRMGSDEALTDTDFGRALGRSFGTNFLSRIEKAVSGQEAAITNEEWTKLVDFAKTYTDEMRNTVKEADPSGKLLRHIKAWPGDKAGAPAGGTGSGKSGRVKVPIDDSADF